MDSTILCLDEALERDQMVFILIAPYVFASPSVEFLGHRIYSRGIQKSDKYIKAIRDAPATKEEQLFLTKATYYSSESRDTKRY